MTDIVDSKRIIICCDGTWQSAVSGEKNSPSNVTRLARCLKRAGEDKDGKIWQQVVWYDSGVGTTSGWVGRKLEGAVGQGLEGNVIEAYNFCALNYAPGDQIMCFGFSRGAYTARAIAGLISDIGICRPNGLHHFHEIWELYKQCEPGQRFYGSNSFFDYRDGIPAPPSAQHPDVKSEDDPKFVWQSPPHGDWASYGPDSRNIEVVGVFDTVGSLGMPSVFGYQAKVLFGPDKLKYHNVRLSRNIKRAYHALAIDEHREAFSPTLWHLSPSKPASSVQATGTEADIEKLENEWKAIRLQEASAAKDAKRLEVYDARRAQFEKVESVKPRSQLRQVWFPGVHINIGGGSDDSLKDQGDLEETANITFAWMLDQVRDHVAIDHDTVLKEARDLAKHIDGLNERATANAQRLKDAEAAAKKASWSQWAYNGLSSAASSAMHPFTKTEQPSTSLRTQGWGTGTIIDSFTSMYAANGSKPRTPGQYTSGQQKAPADQTAIMPVASSTGTEVVPSGSYEMIHPTVGYRMFTTKDSKPRYFPTGLDENKITRDKVVKDGEVFWEYAIDGIKLREWRLQNAAAGAGPCESPFERFAVLGTPAQDYVTELDREYFKYGNQGGTFIRQFMGVPPEETEIHK